MREGLTYFKLQTSRLVRAAAITIPLKAVVMAKNLVREWVAGGGTATSLAESPPVPTYGCKVFLLVQRVHLRS